MEIGIGYTVDRYTLVEKLGEGGMAVVYRVEHATLGTPHALKVLTMGGRQVKDRLVQEGRVQATLQHPHIVAVTDVLDIQGSPGLLMEYVDGPSLDDWLGKYRPTVEEAVILFRGIVAGVGQAHARGLIHRDLKPGNVMLQVTDHGVVPKVADFGLAKVTDGSGANSMKRTRTGMTMGTPAYMAPEQIRDSSSVDRRADLYSLGCMLYEMVCGETPFQGDDMLSLFAAIAVGKYTPIRERVPEIPDAVEAVIEGLLVDNAMERISDCASILDLLDHGGANQSGPITLAPGDPDLSPPAPVQNVGTSVLPLDSAAADVARAMTRGVVVSSEISQVGWTSTAPVSPSQVHPPSIESTSTVSVTTLEATTSHETKRSFDESTSLVIPVGKATAKMAFLGGAGLLVFGGAVAVSIGLALFFLTGEEESPTDRPVVVQPVPVEPSHPIPLPPDIVPEEVETVRPDPAPVRPDPAPVRPDPAPVRPDPAPVRPDPAPVRPAPAPVRPDPAPVRPDPEPAVTTGRFSFSGADKVVLKSSVTGESFSAGSEVPVGRYSIFVDGQNGGSTVTIRKGATVKLKCVSVMGTCVTQ